jgi:hypothetical protein
VNHVLNLKYVNSHKCQLAVKLLLRRLKIQAVPADNAGSVNCPPPQSFIGVSQMICESVMSNYLNLCSLLGRDSRIHRNFAFCLYGNSVLLVTCLAVKIIGLSGSDKITICYYLRVLIVSQAICYCSNGVLGLHSYRFAEISCYLFEFKLIEQLAITSCDRLD